MLSELSGLFGLLQAPKDKQSGAEGALGDLIFDDVYKEVTPDSGLETSVEDEAAPPTEELAATALAEAEDAQEEDEQSTDSPDDLIPETVQVVERQSDADGFETPQEPPVDPVDAVEIDKQVAITAPGTPRPVSSPAERGAAVSVEPVTHSASAFSKIPTQRDELSDPVATVARTEKTLVDVAETTSAPLGANVALALTASSLAPDVTRQPEIVADRLVMRQAEQKVGAMVPLSATQVRTGTGANRSNILVGRRLEEETLETTGAVPHGVPMPAIASMGGPIPARIDVEVSGAGSASEASVKVGVIEQRVFAASQEQPQAAKNRESILSGQTSPMPRGQVEGSIPVDSSISADRAQAPSSDVQMAVGRDRPIWRSALAIRRSAGHNLALSKYQSGISTQGEMANRAEGSARGTPAGQPTSTSAMAITAQQDAALGRTDAIAEPMIPARADVDVNSGSTKAETVEQRVPSRSVQVGSQPAQAIPSQEMTRATTQPIPDELADGITQTANAAVTDSIEPHKLTTTGRPPSDVLVAAVSEKDLQATAETKPNKLMSISFEDASDRDDAKLTFGNPKVASNRDVSAATSEAVTTSAYDSDAVAGIGLSAESSTAPTKSDSKTLRGALLPIQESVSSDVPQAAQSEPFKRSKFPEIAPNRASTESRSAIIADGDAASDQIVGSPPAERPANPNPVFKPDPSLRDTPNTPIAGSDRMTPIGPIQISNNTGPAPTRAQPENTLHAPNPRASFIEQSGAMGATSLSESFEIGVPTGTAGNQPDSAVATAASSVATKPDKALATFSEIPAKVSILAGDTSIQLTRAAASTDITPADGTSASEDAPVAPSAQTPPMFRSSRAGAHGDTVSVSMGRRASIDAPFTPPAGNSAAGQMDPSETSDDIMSPGDAIGVTSADMRSASASTHAATPPSARAEHTSAVMRQIVDAATTGTPNSDGSIELQLRPDELGHVRFKMMHGEHGMTMHISAERPETLDMLRRNIDQLSRYLDDLGYESTSFSFGDGQTGSNSGGDRAMPVTAQDVPQLTDSPDTAPPLSITSGGLDLRF